MRNYGLLCLFSVWVYGCAGTPYQPGPAAYQVVKPGSILKLNQELTIPPESAGVLMQYGKVTHYTQTNQWYPNCRFEVRDPADTAQVFQPDEFVVTKVRFESQYVAAELPLLAAIGIGFGLFGDRGGGPTAEVMSTSFQLQSQTQPKVWRLICQHWEDPKDSRHLTLAEIQQAVGGIIEFRLTPAP